ncbi:LytTr DNA-binding region [Gemmatirosa kalamazoonensis]|uniref:LytTr DNA-binding region n=1 Tax=Gemmatirosa kalamazoonensis TaxID=861299 RepID=W0REZ5_9BACT|nr:LytTR family DNA-binding domain-containing protein [Gemmatirosa kalamazoonensis]AHG88900.1 LytTr DNA-binding region [Gemmatirosa kalamazoonensis]
MIRTVIADDEPLARRGVRQLLAPHRDVTVVAEARNGEEALRVLRACRPDLVFLDVQMPELDGFGVLRELGPGFVPAVVFLTAYDTFAVRAFDARALDYLVKPVEEARFLDAMERARERLRGAAPTPRRLLVPVAGGELLLDLDEIDWIEADDYYAAVHARGRRHLLRESLASLAERLDASRFVRAHRSAIVNIDRVRELRAESSGETVLVLRDGTRVPVSRRRREVVVDAIRRSSG